MESQFNNNDFERFLKQNADQYRMFPSENVWKGIHNTLHTRRRWHGIGLALLLLSTGGLTWLMLSNSATKNPATLQQTVSAARKQTAAKPAAPVLTPPKANKVNYTPIASPGNQEKNLFIASSDWETVPSGLNPLATQQQVATGTSAKTILDKESTTLTAETRPIGKPATAMLISRPVIIADSEKAGPVSGSKPGEMADLLPVPEAEKENTATRESLFDKTDIPLYPLTIESVLNSYLSDRKKRKATWQFYITPTVTYRKLNENKQFINNARSNIGAASVVYSPDLNNLVTHRPDIGFQLGLGAAWPLSEKLSFTAGLQFNISKYDIWAYSYPSEVATIALRTDYGGTSTVSTVSNYRIIGFNRANKANWLRNFYFSASAPVGLDYSILRTKKNSLGVVATVQPTYVLGNRAWVISTDYKNYAEVPSLTRKVNVNAGIETYAGFKMGRSSWRIGPQVRYQTMSSFKKQYPVKEHLFDYGLKLGILLNQ